MLSSLRPLVVLTVALSVALWASACVGGSEPPDTHLTGDAGPGAPLADTEGLRTFALQQVSSRIVTNPSPFSSETAVSSISAWLRVQWHREGTEIVWEEALCAMRSNEVFGTTTHYPAAFLESIPRRLRRGHLEVAEVGARFEAGPFVDLFGAQLEEPATEILPTSEDDPRVEDTDGDGQPGITVHIDQSLLGEGEVFVVQRSTTRLTGVVLSADRIEGQVEVETEQNVLGATAGWLEGGTESVVDPDPTHNFFIFQAISEKSSCFEIVLDRGEIFGGG